MENFQIGTGLVLIILALAVGGVILSHFQLRSRMRDTQQSQRDMGERIASESREVLAALEKAVVGLEREIGSSVSDVRTELQEMDTIKGEMAIRDVELKSQISGVKAELGSDVSSLGRRVDDAENRLTQDVAGVKAELRSSVKEAQRGREAVETRLRRDMAEVKVDLVSALGAVKTDLKTADTRRREDVIGLRAAIGSAVDHVREHADMTETRLREDVLGAKAGLRFGVRDVRRDVEADTKPREGDVAEKVNSISKSTNTGADIARTEPRSKEDVVDAKQDVTEEQKRVESSATTTFASAGEQPAGS